MSDEMNSLINQARSQAKSEGLTRFFNKNKKTISTLAIATSVALVGFLVIDFVQTSRQEKFSEILHQSLINQQVGDIAKAKENLKKIYDTKSAPSGVRSLASLRYAAFLLEEGKKEEAAKIYLEINECRSCDDYIQSLAGLLAVKVWLSDEAEIQKADLSARIEKVENSSKILRHYIAEQRAFLEMQKNNLEKSYQIFESIEKSPDVDQATKARAADGLKMLAAKGFEPKSEASAKSGVEEKVTEEKAAEEKATEKKEAKEESKHKSKEKKSHKK